MSLKTQNYIENRGGSPIRDDFLFTMGVMVFTQKQSYNEMVMILVRRSITHWLNVHKSLSDFLEKPFHANLSLSHNIGYHHLYQAGNLSKVQDYILYNFSRITSP